MVTIGLVGKNGSGKSTVCQLLADKGFSVYSLSDCIRDVATERGLAHDRDQLTLLANELKQQYGTDYFAKFVFQKAKDQGITHVVFDSIRHKDECRFLLSSGVRLVAIDCSLEQRYQRISKRQRESDFVDFETFIRQDERESDGSSFGQTLNECLSLCEFTVLNNDGLSELQTAVDEVLDYVS